MNIHNRYGEKIDHALHEGNCDDKLVILGHGVTGDKDRDLMVELASMIAAKGYSIMRISYAGCGESGGDFRDATISKEVEDLHSVLDQVKGSKKIAYIGYSMGGAVGAMAAAKDDRINVLISLAGMVHTKKFAEREFGGVTPDEGYMWDNKDAALSKKYMDDLTQIDTVIPAVKEHRIPWLLLHGSEDDVVFPEDSATLFNHIKGKKKHVVIDGTDHSFEGHWPLLAEEATAWLDTYL